MEKLAVTDTGALEDLGGPESTRGQDDHLAGLDDGFLELTTVGTVTRGYIRNANSLIVVVEENARDASVAAQEKVVLDIHNGVDISCE
jgi:hypothetical protein